MRALFCFEDCEGALSPENVLGLDFKPLAPELIDDMRTVLRGSWGSTCWCLFPRLTDAEMREVPGDGPLGARRREAMTKLAGGLPAPGLLAFEDEEPVGWIAVAPRNDLTRIVRSRATPPVDEERVWVIPCITVRKSHRGRGIAVALIEAAVIYASEQGAPTVEAYPRADGARTRDDNIYFGTETLFRRAEFQKIREPLKSRPRNWLPRVTMRISAARLGCPVDATPLPGAP